MSRSITKFPSFACPKCGVDIGPPDPHGPGELMAGANAPGDPLVCPVCSKTYPIVRGVRRFVTGSGYSESFGFQWNKFRRTQLDSFSGLSVSRDRLFHATGWPHRLDGEVVLEAGSGAGRFTEVLAEMGARVYSFDLSNAVEANHSNNGHRENVELFQASIFGIPFRPGFFEKVICLGVLQHTPDPDRAFSSLAAMVRPGGDLVIDVYARSFKAMLSWKYILRPITRRMNQESLFRVICAIAPRLVAASRFLRRVAGAPGARLVPILQYAHWGLSDELNRQWAILDTFDMLSPAFDNPRSVDEVRSWFVRAGFQNVRVEYGPNGVIGRGRRPLKSPGETAGD